MPTAHPGHSGAGKMAVGVCVCGRMRAESRTDKGQLKNGRGGMTAVAHIKILSHFLQRDTPLILSGHVLAKELT